MTKILNSCKYLLLIWIFLCVYSIVNHGKQLVCWLDLSSVSRISFGERFLCFFAAIPAHFPWKVHVVFILSFTGNFWICQPCFEQLPYSSSLLKWSHFHPAFSLFPQPIYVLKISVHTCNPQLWLFSFSICTNSFSWGAYKTSNTFLHIVPEIFSTHLYTFRFVLFLLTIFSFFQFKYLPFSSLVLPCPIYYSVSDILNVRVFQAW